MGIIRWSRMKSPWILYMCTGACNACDIEVIAALTPRFDVERFGILLKGSPRHADVLVVTGAVSRHVAPRLKRIYEQMPHPKFVMAVGTCACSGGVYWGCYNVLGGIDKVIPVDVYVPGCPVRPEAVIQGVAKLLAKIQSGGK
ncbi:MAG: NADH-quinone oxidoreductase subunit B [Candidatus Methanomethylicota archaeon]|uniref:NADH-quinone oxidoreductase subunit B n=1 Tax=Thermoproteota archaeon TaxID=2056631 RepID=A0A497EZV1_9CREN|nr:MAG: NADH-quinone oxidoreductase subunit B [Candidatus Verstraetearchaeota archaeon]